MLGRPKVVSTTQADPFEAAPPSARDYDFVEVYGGRMESPQRETQRGEAAAQKPGLFSSIRKFLGF